MKTFLRRAGDGTWTGDLAELLEPLFPEGKLAVWLRNSLLFLLFAAALVVGFLLMSQRFEAEVATPTETPAMASPTPEPTPTPTETPPAPALRESALETIPGEWKPDAIPGCKASWESSSKGISSLLATNKAKEAFEASGLTASTSFTDSSFTTRGQGKSGDYSYAELLFTLEGMTLCFK